MFGGEGGPRGICVAGVCVNPGVSICTQLLPGLGDGAGGVTGGVSVWIQLSPDFGIVA